MNTDTIIKMLKLMERVEKLSILHRGQKINYESTDRNSPFNEHYEILVNETKVTCNFWYMNDGDIYWRSHEIFKISFSDIDAYSNIHSYCLTYSPLNKNCTVGGNRNFKIVEPYEFDEALYFQTLTLHDLQEEEVYREACKILQSIWKGNFVYLYLNFHNIESHIEHVENLILRWEFDYAQYN